MLLAAKARLIANDAGGLQPISDVPFYTGGAEEYPESNEILLESCLCANCRPNLDQQPDMAVPVALVNGDLFEDVTEPLQNNPPSAEQQNDRASVYSSLDSSAKRIVDSYEKTVRTLVKNVKSMRESEDGALNELADDLAGSVSDLVRTLKIMKGLQ